VIDSFFENVLDQYHLGIKLQSYRAVGGGCINQAIQLKTDDGHLFLKYTSASESTMFDAEAKGLQVLMKSSKLKIPEVLGSGTIDGKSYLLLEWIESGHASINFWKIFGDGLAKLHKTTAKHFGLDHSNFIGRLSQSNRYHENWYEFFINERLTPQLKMAHDRGLVDRRILTDFELLFPKLETLIPEEPPALIHGDLWSGNFLTDEHSKPVLIDPAIHYGHRETELAFTHLFGGFDSIFYETYQDCYPLEKGFGERIDIHNLYPLLVHVNLFGTSYLSGIKQTLQRLV